MSRKIFTESTLPHHLRLKSFSLAASYRVDETYIKGRKSCKYIYRTVESTGQAIEFMLSAKRDVSKALRFFKKMIRADHRRLPFTIFVDKNGVYPQAFIISQQEKVIPHDCKLRRVKYLNNIIEAAIKSSNKEIRQADCRPALFLLSSVSSLR
jgi:transposase-like protein